VNTKRPWQAKSECPQCGARVDLDVGSPLLSCRFCRTSLYLCPDGPLAYFMEADRRPRAGVEALVHLPFWRFRGIRYRVRDGRIHGTLVDATTPAATGLPHRATLGIRPQVAPLTLLAHGRRMVRASVSDKTALQQAQTRVKLAEAERPELERFIGETQCLIHAPFLLRPVRDAGDGELVGAWRGAALRCALPADEFKRITETGLRPAATVSRRFLSLVCPECAGDLPAVDSAVGLICPSCLRGWSIQGQTYQPLAFRVLRTADPGPEGRFLPFWQLDLLLDGVPLETRAEMRRALIPYQPVPPSWENDPLRLFVPAFKLNPQVLVRLAGNISLAPFDDPAETADFRHRERAESLRLPLTEAAQAVKIVLCSLFGRNRNLAPLAVKARLRITAARPVFLPFRSRGRDYVEPLSNQSVPAEALRLGHFL